LALVAGLAMSLSACTSVREEPAKDAQQVALCTKENGDDLGRYCNEALLNDPYTMCGTSADRVSPPDGYADSAEYAAKFAERCIARKWGQLLSCHAKVCKDLFNRYEAGGSQAVQRVVNRFRIERHEWCSAEDVSVWREDSCDSACMEQTGYYDSFLVTTCHVSTWAECRVCEEGKHDAYMSCLAKCAAQPCFNGARDGAESDLDCGGGACRGCVPGKLCNVDSDCQSRHCEQGQCAAATCNDGIHNQLEADVDCGRWCGKPCAVGQHCADNVDCVSSNCKIVEGNLGLGNCE
jgi:hypothetical protein